MSLLDILNEETEATFNPKIEAKNAYVDINAKIKEQPILVSCGRNWEDKPLCVLGEGDFSVITGQSKSKKSFFKSMMMASYISGDETDARMPFRTHRINDKIVLDIDTEQSDYHAQRAFKRIETIAGRYDNYKPYALRKYTAKERLLIVDEVVETYKDKIGLMSIDGYIDLVDSFNDEVEARLLVEKLMKWTGEYKIHITGILHQNPGTAKMIGHIGSAIIRKASSVFNVVRDEERKAISTVYNPRGRDEEFDPFEIEINMGLPYKL